ncbi:histidine-rich glycoprotein [Rousettus aegyptiacus]|uniref:Histidine-rich glycoprotein n=1 Tax=Rousettus aegyptiacus TaxID=9407 RepID=A0A7J8HQ17_ROUAE|nr:histidine-rich glycoprotein [Rousettus aegyptiacus]KAF6474383.1 histidine rich glycoprotein [Rousettus aegyptiacus]
MKVFTAALLLIFLIMLQYSCAVSPTDCNAVEPLATKAVELINMGRRNGYLFQLLRVADAHLDKLEFVTVYYLVLDVKESDCPVRSGIRWDDCEPVVSRRPSDIVIGQCKVVATTHLNESQDLRVNDFNCTTSSVSSALANTKDSPVLFDYFEDTELYRKQTDKALEKYKKENGDFASFRVDQVERVVRVRGGERTNYYVDFSVRNCSGYHFPRNPNVFGFCRADLSYDAETSDMETPKDLVVNCEVFNLKEYRNFSDPPPHPGHPFHFGGHEHSPFKPNGSRPYHHPHKPHKFGCPPPPEEKSHSDRPLLQAGAPPPLPPPRCHHPHFGTNETHVPPHNHSTNEHHPHGHPPHGHPPHGHPPHGHPPHGHHPHGPPPHGHHPHGPPPHGHHPHGHPPHGHPPHGHPPHDFGPCDPLPLNQSHHPWGHGPPPRHSEKRGPGKEHIPFKWRHVKYVYRLPPLKKGEVLPLPDANFPIFSLPDRMNPLKPEFQPFPQSASESCPGVFKSELSQVSQFFAHTFLKENLGSLKKE